MAYLELYQSKLGTLDDCLAQIQSHDVIAFGGNSHGPQLLLHSLHTIADRVEDVQGIKTQDGVYPFQQIAGLDGRINVDSNFFGAGHRQGYQNGTASFIPADLCDYPKHLTECRQFNVFAAAVAPMDEDGNFQVGGLCMLFEEELLEQVRSSPNKKIILEVNPRIPRVRGGINIHISEVTVLTEADYHLREVASTEPTPEELIVAQNVRSLLRDGDCVQFGIGALPNAIAAQCMDLRDLGLHTEMITSSIGEMIRRGVITGARKNLNPDEHIFTFAGGDQALYDTIGSAPAIRVVPARYGISPAVIMQNDNMVSINTCIEMDLTGQTCSESLGPLQYSGSGGGFCYAYGALHSRGGRGILAFASRTKKGKSKISTMLALGSNVSIPRNYVDYVVTEYGIARLRGRTVRQRVEQLIAIAHPDIRDDLRRDAKKLLYI